MYLVCHLPPPAVCGALATPVADSGTLQPAAQSALSQSAEAVPTGGM